MFLVPATVLCGAFAESPASGPAQAATGTSVPLSASTVPDTQPRCQVIGNREIEITCDYTPMPADSAQTAGKPQIALNHAELSFGTKDDNWMSLELKVTKLDGIPIAEIRQVYLAVDDDDGRNFIRRPLPSANLASLEPGQSAEFKERLRFPALQPGHYQVKLWIPSVDPIFKFNAAHNLLVSSFGVPDEKSGLNTIAAFSVKR